MLKLALTRAGLRRKEAIDIVDQAVTVIVKPLFNCDGCCLF
jgi:hypothetical protein